MQTVRAVLGLEVRRVDDLVEIDPLVDGVPLGDVLDLDLAGILVATADGIAAARDGLLGRGSTWGRPVYGVLQVCGCGIDDDDLLAARITVTDDVVRWSDFQQQSEPPTTFGAFGPIEFDRVAYEQEVEVRLGEAARLLAP